MTLILSKPTQGAVGWGSSANQNWTDIETEVNKGVGVALVHVDSATSMGPSATGVAETIGSGYTMPANTFTQDGDMVKVSFYMNRGGSAGSATYNAKVASSSLTGLNVTQTAGTAVEFHQELIMIRASSSTLKCIQRSTWLNNGVGYSAVTLTTVTSLDFGSTIQVDSRVTESASTNATTRHLLYVERWRKS